MTQQELCFDGYPRNPFTVGTQNWRLYERLTDGPVTNAEIVRKMGIFNSTGRISDLRRRLQSMGLDVDGRAIDRESGLWEYRIRRTA